VTEHRVKIAEWAVAAAPDTLAAIGLGSCVAIVLHDAAARIGGLAHVLLPAPVGAHAAEHPGRSPGTALPLVLAAMRAKGANGAITARLVGGASLFGSLLGVDGGGVGARNIAASRAALAAANVRVVGELVGGRIGRSVSFDVATGRCAVRALREGTHVL